MKFCIKRQLRDMKYCHQTPSQRHENFVPNPKTEAQKFGIKIHVRGIKTWHQTPSQKHENLAWKSLTWGLMPSFHASDLGFDAKFSCLWLGVWCQIFMPLTWGLTPTVHASDLVFDAKFLCLWLGIWCQFSMLLTWGFDAKFSCLSLGFWCQTWCLMSRFYASEAWKFGIKLHVRGMKVKHQTPSQRHENLTSGMKNWH